MIWLLPIQLGGKPYMKRVNVEVIPIENNEKFEIISPYDADLVQELKAMAGGRWNPDKKCWVIPNNERNCYAIEWLKGNRPRYPEISYQSRRPLMEHQHEGVEFILSRRRCMLAFEMRLGKTLTTLEAIEEAYRNNKLNWWLIAPFGAQQEWKRQIERWNSPVRFTVTTSYESLHTYMDAIEKIPDGVVFDESIKIKNHSAQRSQVANELCRIVRERNGFIILLSGSPAPKEPTDWWHQIECIQPGFLREGDTYKFRNRYANIIQEQGEYGAYSKIASWKEKEVEALGTRLAPIVLVKRKKDCLDLPDKIFDKIYCQTYLTEDQQIELFRMAELVVCSAKTGIEALERLRQLSDGFQYTKSTEYTDEDNRSIGTLPDSNRDVGSTDTDTTKPIINKINPKLLAVRELLDLYHTDNGGPGRLVIYAWYRQSIDMIATEVKSCGWSVGTIYGGGWSNKNVLDHFDDDKFSNVCIVANPASVHGLNFEKTIALVYYSNSFTGDHRTQSIERRDSPGMDKNNGTRIVDLINLPTDVRVVEVVTKGLDMQDITLEELKRCLKR